MSDQAKKNTRTNLRQPTHHHEEHHERHQQATRGQVFDPPGRSSYNRQEQESMYKQPTMTEQEQTMRTFDHLTSHVDKFHIKDGYLSPGASSIKSSKSLHNLGLDNYPYPDMPEEKRLTRKGEKQSLQNLNNRLAGYIDKVRGNIHGIYHVFTTYCRLEGCSRTTQD